MAQSVRLHLYTCAFDKYVFVGFRIGKQKQQYKTVLYARDGGNSVDAGNILSKVNSFSDASLAVTAFYKEVAALRRGRSREWSKTRFRSGNAYCIDTASQTYVCCFFIDADFCVWITTLGKPVFPASVQAWFRGTTDALTLAQYTRTREINPGKFNCVNQRPL